MPNKNRGTPNDILRKVLDIAKTTKQLDRIYIRDKGICYICGLWMRRREATRHHLDEFKNYKLEDVTEELKRTFRSDANVKLAHEICNNNESNEQRKIGTGLILEDVEPFTHSMEEQLKRWTQQNFTYESD